MIGSQYTYIIVINGNREFRKLCDELSPKLVFIVDKIVTIVCQVKR